MGRLSKSVLAMAVAVLTAAVTVQPAQAAQERPPLPDTTDAAFNQECLAAHNSYRAQHGAPALALDDAAIAHAVQRAQAASTLDGLSTPPGPGSKGYGENRYWFATYENEPASCEEAVRLWYEARWTGNYDWDRPGYSPDTASFTQVVWKNTGTLGCGRASGYPEDGESHQTFIVCSYSPAGNIIGQFRENVGAPAVG